MLYINCIGLELNQELYLSYNPPPWADNATSGNQPPKVNTSANDVRFLEELIQSFRLDMVKIHQELAEVKKSQETKVPTSPPQYVPTPQYMYYHPNAQAMQLTNQPYAQPRMSCV